MYSVKNTALRKQPVQSPRLSGKVTAAATVMLVTMFAGCAGQDKNHFQVGSVPDDYRTRHPIVVSDSEVHEDLAISAKMKTLSMRDRNVVRDFALRFKNSGSRSVRIVLPVGSRNEHAARRVSRQIAHEFKDVGVHGGAIMMTTYAASGHGDAATVRMAFNTMKASVASKCGEWKEDLNHDGQNKNYANFGCSTQSNLAAMVADPADLLGPRGESEIDATRRDAVITDWRTNGAGQVPVLFD